MKNLLFLLALTLLLSCQPQSAQNPHSGAASDNHNPAAPGFDAEGSDPEAIAIADQVMAAMGGRTAWDNSRYLHWNFFGMRSLLWDKQRGRVRIDIPKDSLSIVVHLDSLQGQASQNGRLLSGERLQEQLDRGKSIWINDAYWLFMPFKLKDSGLTLKQLGSDSTQAGRPAHRLQLTFEGVGDTPHNKYHVWVDKEDHLVRQWAYFENASDKAPKFITPWQDYQAYGQLLLSGSRGKRQITDIRVMDTVPEGAFELGNGN